MCADTGLPFSDKVLFEMADEGGRLLELVDSQRIAYGREDSFKMSHGQLLAGRFLLGLRTRDISPQGVMDIAAKLGMPEPFTTIFLHEYGVANMVLFGVEESEKGCICKAYLEFWDKVRSVTMATASREPALLHLGFKWYARDNSIQVIARYTCFPLLDLAGILSRIRRIHHRYAENPSCWIACRFVQLAARHHVPMIYMEVSEEGTPRLSFDINLYKAYLTLADVEPLLLEAATYFSLSREQFDTLYARNRTRVLGHLAGGVARDGKDFLTIYYETKQL